MMHREPSGVKKWSAELAHEGEEVALEIREHESPAGGLLGRRVVGLLGADLACGLEEFFSCFGRSGNTGILKQVLVVVHSHDEDIQRQTVVLAPEFGIGPDVGIDVHTIDSGQVVVGAHEAGAGKSRESV
jgi:hypothetical protein